LFAVRLATGNTAGNVQASDWSFNRCGIQHGLSEAMSDDGKTSAGVAQTVDSRCVCGLMTNHRRSGPHHAISYRDFHLATNQSRSRSWQEAGRLIAWIRKRYMDTTLLRRCIQVVVGGVLVFLAGWLIGMG